MYKISRSVCYEQQLKQKMHVVDIRTVYVTTTDIHAKPIIHRIFRIMHLPLNIIMCDIGKCIHVHHNS